jgi:hypothetical protein
MIGQTRLHRRSDAQALVNLAKVVVRKMNRQHVAVIFDLLRKSVCQTGEPAIAHANGQILAFNVAGGNQAFDPVPYKSRGCERCCKVGILSIVSFTDRLKAQDDILANSLLLDEALGLPSPALTRAWQNRAQTTEAAPAQPRKERAGSPDPS